MLFGVQPETGMQLSVIIGPPVKTYCVVNYLNLQLQMSCNFRSNFANSNTFFFLPQATLCMFLNEVNVLLQRKPPHAPSGHKIQLD